MPRNANTKWVKGFTGYSDTVATDDAPTLTNDLLNVKVRNGRIFGRGGQTKWNSISAAASEAIIGLFNYRLVSGTHKATRMLLTKFEEFSGGVWNDVTGSPIASVATTQPQATIIDDTLIFTNGIGKPRKYEGTGSTTVIASNSSPYSKGVISYLGFLFLTNVSDDGSFTDVFDGHRIGRYSDDWDNDWATCTGDEITLDETPGAWIASVVLGRSLYAIKSDGVVQVRFTGGQLRFQQELMSADVGCVSPMSVAKAGDSAAFFLGTDGVIYVVSAQGVKAVTYDTLWNTLPTTFSLARLKWARGVVDSEDDTYYLFYDRTGLTDQFLDSYVSYNYRTNEVCKGTLGASVIATTEFKPTDQQAEAILLSTSTLVEEFDAGADDDGVAVSRYWTSGWQHLGTATGNLKGVRVIAKKSATARITIDIATNYDPVWRFPQTFGLRGGAVTDTRVDLTYRIPPTLCETVNVRIRLYHDAAVAATEIQAVGFEISQAPDTGLFKDRNQGQAGG